MARHAHRLKTGSVDPAEVMKEVVVATEPQKPSASWKKRLSLKTSLSSFSNS